MKTRTRKKRQTVRIRVCFVCKQRKCVNPVDCADRYAQYLSHFGGP